MKLELPYLFMVFMAPFVYLAAWKLGQRRRRAREQDALLCRAVVDAAADAAIMVHDLADGARVVYANATACRHFGVDMATLATWTREQLALHGILSPEKRPPPSERAFQRFETEHVTATGGRVPVEVTLSGLDFPGRDFLLLHARDLRPQRDMEAHALRLEKRALEMRLERDYKEIFDNLVDGVFLLDVMADGGLVIANCNRAAERNIGFSAAGIIGKAMEDVLPAEQAARLKGLCQRCLTCCEPVQSHDVQEYAGEEIPIDSTLIPLRQPRGNIYRLVWISRDVTELRRAESAERAREREFRLLVERSRDTVARYDLDCRRVYANPTLMALSGPDALVLGTRPGEFPGGESGHLYEDCLRRVLDTGVETEFELSWDSAGEWPRHTLISLSAERGPAGEVAGVLAIGRDITERKRRESQEAARAEVFDRLSAGDALPGVLARVVTFAELSRPGMLGSILLPEPTGKSLGRVIAPSLSASFLSVMENVPIGEEGGACGAAAFRKSPVYVDDLGTMACATNCHAMARETGLVSCWSMPILDGEGELLGTFAFFRRIPGLPDSEDVSTMEQARQMARLVIERRREEERIRYQADYDSLTGLWNRSALHAQLAIMKEGRRLALLYVDIDNFKEINDTLGHYLGDRMLAEVARRLRSALPSDALVARMSGDEFIVVLDDFEGISQVERLAEGVRAAMASNYVLEHGTVWGSASIGIAVYPEQACDVHELLSYGDQALYAAKAAGRNCVRMFDQAMLEKTRMRMRLASDLRNALQAGQLSVHYQPIFELASGRVCQAEALLRWRHPELGQVSPAVFIPIAEEIGVIHEIGNWVFHEAARVSRDWNFRVLAGGPHRIAINRSPNQFFTLEGVDDWCAFMAAEGVPGEFLGVEITEGMLLDDRPEVIRQLRQLRAMGMTVSLDDFGTGYSALSYLKKFEIDYLKIDRSFIRDITVDPSDRAIVESIIVMAMRLGIKLVAEGVETREQAELLAAAGCDMAQGFFYARPMPEDLFLEFVLKAASEHIGHEEIATP
jgi:diguanylate cyclase (GGDEF)-like protein/PAS domain S-box-containing protein